MGVVPTTLSKIVFKVSRITKCHDPIIFQVIVGNGDRLDYNSFSSNVLIHFGNTRFFIDSMFYQ